MKHIFAAAAIFLSSTAAIIGQTAIRDVDFLNFEYDLTRFGGRKEKVTVKNGEYQRNEEDDKVLFNVKVTGFGDLDGDGKDEAVIETSLNTGGTGNFSNGMIYTLKNGRPTLLTEFEGGDRAYGGIVSSKISVGQLIIERNAPDANGTACCAERIEKTRYRWNGRSLTQIGAKVSREIYPPTRVNFKRGTTMSIFGIELLPRQFKRFVVRGRRGQSLLISSGVEPVDAVAYRLIRGEGDVDAGPNGIIVKFKQTGDLVFEIASDTDTALNISVTVEIR